MEKYLHNYSLPKLQELSRILKRPLTFIDLETTALVHQSDFSLIEVGIVNITPTTVSEFTSLIDPQRNIPKYITDITHITNDMVKGKPTFNHFIKHFQQIAHNHVLLGYNSRSFDSKGIELLAKQKGHYYSFDNQIDIRHVFLQERNLKMNIKSQAGKLLEACSFYNVSIPGQAHRASYDIAITTLLAENILAENDFKCLVKEVNTFICNDTKQRFLNYINRVSIAV